MLPCKTPTADTASDICINEPSRQSTRDGPGRLHTASAGAAWVTYWQQNARFVLAGGCQGTTMDLDSLEFYRRWLSFATYTAGECQLLPK